MKPWTFGTIFKIENHMSDEKLHWAGRERMENGSVAHIEPAASRHCSLESWAEASAHALASTDQFSNTRLLSGGRGHSSDHWENLRIADSHLWVYWIGNLSAYLHTVAFSLIALTPKHQQSYHYCLSPPSEGAPTECVWNRLRDLNKQTRRLWTTITVKLWPVAITRAPTIIIQYDTNCISVGNLF